MLCKKADPSYKRQIVYENMLWGPEKRHTLSRGSKQKRQSQYYGQQHRHLTGGMRVRTDRLALRGT